MLDYNLEKRGGASLYEFVYQQIRDDIVAGRIAAGEHLPSKRAFASHLGISVITIENAYSQLLAEGIFAQSRAVVTTRASFPMHRFWLRLRRASTEMTPPWAPARMMSTDRSSDSMCFLLPLWRRRGFGKARYGRRWHPKTNAKSFRLRRHRAPLGYDALSLTICVGRGA